MISTITRTHADGTTVTEEFEVEEYIPTPEELAAQAQAEQQRVILALTHALEGFYDKTAQTKNYDNRLTCTLRAGYAGPFQTEGTSFALWMDNCNVIAYQVMAECLAGTRVIPTAEELISELPVLVW